MTPDRKAARKAAGEAREALSRARAAEREARSVRLDRIRDLKAAGETRREAQQSVKAAWASMKQAKAGLKAAKQTAGPAPMHAIRADLALGKSHTARVEAAAYLETLRARGDGRVVVIAVPTAALGHEQAGKFNALPGAGGLVARVRLGRERGDPEAPGETMCRRLDVIKDVNETLMDLETAACRRVAADGSLTGECPFYSVCGYQRQKHALADVWFLAHEHLFLFKPAEIGEPAAIIVDESPVDAALFGPNDLTADEIEGGNVMIPGGTIDSQRLTFLRRMLIGALDAHGAIADGQEIPLRRDLLIAAGFDSGNASEGHALEWMRKVDVLMWPGMPRPAWRAAVAKGSVNKMIPRLAAMWRAVAALAAEGGPERSGWLSLAMIAAKEGMTRVLRIKGRRTQGRGWDAPVLFLDATLQMELLTLIWPLVEKTADIAVETPHQRIMQVADQSYSLRRMASGTALAAVHAIVCREARRHAPGRALAVAQASVEERLRQHGPTPVNLTTAHHNAVAGRDEWRDVAVEIVVGRTAPSPKAVERQAEALTGVAVEPVQGWYPAVTVAREMADGSWTPAQADRHPHPVAEAMRWRVAEGELIQVIGRARGANRSADDPVRILLMTSTPVPMPVERLVLAADLAPSPYDEMMALGGVVLMNATDAATAYPGRWATRDAARKALERHQAERLATSPDNEYLSGNVANLLQVAYQLAGAGKKPAVAVFDTALVPGPEAWLTVRLGALSRLDFAGAAVPEPDVAGTPMEPAAAVAEVRETRTILVLDPDARMHGPPFVPEMAGGYGDPLDRFPGMRPSTIGAVTDLLTIRATGQTVIVIAGARPIRVPRQCHRRAA